MLSLRWNGQVDGFVDVETAGGKSRRLRGLNDLVEYARANFSEFDETSAMMAGALAFLFAMRDCAPSGSLIDKTERLFDSAYLVVPDRKVQSWIDSGVNHVRSEVFGRRDRSPEEILKVALLAAKSVMADSKQ